VPAREPRTAVRAGGGGIDVRTAVAVWGVMRIWRGPEPTLREPAPLNETTATPDAAETQAETTAAEQTQSSQPEESTELQPFTLEVKVSQSGASWLEITVDDKKAYAGTLTGGQSKEYEVAESASVLVGRPSAVTVYRDGKKVKIPASDDTPTLELEAKTTE